MSGSTKILTIDFETTSAVDLKVCGVDVYAKHPSTKVLCFSYCFDDEPVKTEVLAPGGVIPPVPHDILLHISLHRDVVAHNAAFERAIWNNIVVPMLNDNTLLLTPRQTAQDTMIRAAYWGLPMALNMVANALKLPFGKDPTGHRLMLQCSKPRETRPDGTHVWWHETDPSKLAAIADYCAQDVELERVIHKMLPTLPPDTVEEYVLDAAMNERGLRVDLDRIADLRRISDLAVKTLDKDMCLATNGAVKNTRAVADLTKLVNQHLKLPVTSLDKNALALLLEHPGLPQSVKTIMSYRRDAAKTSTAKFNSMLKCADHEGVIRGVFQFYGATRTGRYAGRLIQPQNFPRPHLKRKELEEEYAALNVYTTPPGDILKLMSSLLRSCIIPNRDKDLLVVVDFAQIEARVLAWIAGQADILAVFANDEDVYTYAATKIGSKDRQLGKVATLGLGYGMGWVKFLDTAATYGLKLDDLLARSIVQSWRNANDKIVKLWYRFDEVIRDLIENRRGVWVKPSATCDIEAAVLWNDAAEEWCLLIRLPSGRLLVYRDPQVDEEGITYMGLDQYTKQWTRIRSYGAKFIENIVQAIARDLMLWVMMRVYRDLGVVPSGTIHDEGIWSVPHVNAQTLLHAVEKLIEDMPNLEPWVAGLPMRGEGFVTVRYGKG